MTPAPQQQDATQQQPIPELHWHVDLHNAPRPVQIARNSDITQPSRLAARPSPLSPNQPLSSPQPQRGSAAAVLSSHKPFGHIPGPSEGNRPATALAAPARPGHLLPASGLERSASCDIAWRLPQMPKAGLSALGGDRNKPAKSALSRAESSAAYKLAGPSKMEQGSGPTPLSRTVSNGRSLTKPPGQGQQPAQSSPAASDPGAARRAKLMALKARTSVARAEAPQPSTAGDQLARPPLRKPSITSAAARPAAAAAALVAPRKTPPSPGAAPRRPSAGEAAVLPKAAAFADARGAAGGRSWKRTGSSSYDESKMVDAGPPADQAGMVRCPGCERTFAPGPFEKHERICAKVFQSKRKPLDMSEQRAVEDKGGGSFGAPPPLPPLRKKGAKPGVGAAAAAATSSPSAAGFVKPKSNVPKWKAQSGQLRAAMAASRGSKTGDLPFAVPSPPDDSLVPCPHCGRRFNEHAAERHIPKCQDIRAKPTRLLAKGRQGRR